MKYVYACITHKCHVDIEEAKQTKKYRKSAEIAKALGIKDIVVDICTSRNRHKHNLENILSTEGNVVVVADITALGQKDELSAVYQRIIRSGNDVLICYYGKGGVLEADELSSVSLSFTRIGTLSVEQVLEKLDAMTSSQYLSDSRRTIDPRIADGYWQIEKGEKTQLEVVKELGTCKSTFSRRVEEYIGTDDWISRYVQELDNGDILNTPTKLGGVSEDAKRLYEYLKANPTELESYPLEVVVSFAQIDMETWNTIGKLEQEGGSKEERDRLSTRYYVMAHHLYRQTIKYDKYLKQLKYRQ